MEQRRRKYVSKACQQCRQRRTKCDGVQPVCSPCRDRSESCQYSASTDHRKPAPKAYVQLLRSRIELLEQVLRSNSIDVEEAVAKSATDLGSAGCPTASPHGSGPETSSFEQLCAAYEGALSLDESLTFDQDGEVRYFGPTSGRLEFQPSKSNVDYRSLLSGYVPDKCTVNEPDGQHASPISTTDDQAFVRSRPHQNQFLLELEHDHVDENLQSHLIDLYFTWQNPWTPIVDEDLFRQSEPVHGRYSSPLLLNCMLAAGSRFSDRTEVRSDPQDPTSAGRFFLEKAEILLHYDLKWPRLTTIQALSILVGVYVGNGAESAAWLHQGMAIRVAFDLGLNFDATSLPGSHLISNEEAELRRRMYWVLYCDDKLHALYTGRVCTMMDIQAAVKLPSPRKSPQVGDDGGRDVQLKLHCALIGLSQVLEKMILGFYVPKPQYHGMQREAFFDSCLLEIRSWAYDLPHNLRLETSNEKNTVPQVYTLHMVYHTTLILLGNALLSVKSRTAVLSHQTCQKALDTCHEAARNVCIVAKKFRDVFGSFRRSPVSATHCLHSAALIFIQIEKTRGSHPNIRAVSESANLCLNALAELSFAWNPAGRICQNLSYLRSRQGTALRGPATRISTGDRDTPPSLGMPGIPTATGVDDSTEVQSCDHEAFDVFMPLLKHEDALLPTANDAQCQPNLGFDADLFSDGLMDPSFFMDVDLNLT